LSTGMLLEAAKDGNIAAVKQHIAAGTDVNAKDAGWGDLTPLHYAAQKGHKEIIEPPIANGVNVNAKNAIDKTPLDWANQFNRTEIADLLRKHGGKTRAELKAEGK
jgi:ankyrin repeat protein